jgi:hypothetical protein
VSSSDDLGGGNEDAIDANDNGKYYMFLPTMKIRVMLLFQLKMLFCRC